MSTVWHHLKRHLIAYFFYLLYLLVGFEVFSNILWFENQMRHHPDKSGIANGGELVGLGNFFFFFSGFIFISVTALYIIITAKSEENFYWWLILAVIVPLIIIGNI